MDQLQLDIQKERLDIQKQTEIRQQKLEEILLQTQEQKNLLELTNRGQISWKRKCVLTKHDIRVCEGLTFPSNFRRFKELYATNWANSKKVRLLLRKLGATKHTKFVNYILIRKTNELTFTEAVKLLIELFSRKTSLFNTL